MGGPHPSPTCALSSPLPSPLYSPHLLFPSFPLEVVFLNTDRGALQAPGPQRGLGRSIVDAECIVAHPTQPKFWVTRPTLQRPPPPWRQQFIVNLPVNVAVKEFWKKIG